MEFCFRLVCDFFKSRSVATQAEELRSFLPPSAHGWSDKEGLQLINWIRFVPAYLQNSETFSWAVSQLQTALAHSTYLLGPQLTLADVAVWAFLESSNECQHQIFNEHVDVETFGSDLCHVKRYYSHLTSLETLTKWREALSEWRTSHPAPPTLHPTTPVPEVTGKTTAAGMRFEEGGKFGELPGAKMGQVVVRFPPEAGGYLHVGHAKAALLNQHYRDTYKGRLILRFDDTNPAKEKAVYEESILSDLPRLGVHWDVRTHTSDHFETLMQLCEKLLREGKAYADNTDGETMKTERENRIPSACRENSIEKNLHWWDEMKKGSEFGVQCCIRAKIDMNSNNGALRDPTIYRCKRESHVRTGNKYNVYPIYDFACPIVDSVEGVTHALRTSEYNDRNEQYAWMCEALGLRCPHVIDYSRLALQNTVLSKRKLTWFVDEGVVDGWDDPRMPTVSGILRRGMTAEGLRQFILAQGSSRSSAQMEWDKIWAFNKKVIDPIAPRHTGLLLDPTVACSDDKAPHGLVSVRVHGQTTVMEKQVPIHPKNEKLGQRACLLGPLIYVEHADAVCFKEGENVTFINWGNCRVAKIYRSDGLVTAVDVQLNLEDTDYKKTLKVTWLAATDERSPSLTPVSCIVYDHLLTKAIIGKDDDFKMFINRNSKVEQCLLGDPALKNLKKGDIVQLQRRGYYICDAPYESKCPSTGHESPCVLIQIPEGTTKSENTYGPSTTSAPKGSGGSSKHKPSTTTEMTEEEAAKAAERQRKKDEKKEARKEGRAKAKENKQQQAGQPPEQTASAVKPQPTPVPKKAVEVKPASSDAKSQLKKQTKLALEARKETDFADWYTQLLTKAELLEYYDISGCYIIRPWAYSIWQTIQRFMDARLQIIGIENAYFPIFVSKAALEREKTHVTDFAPEVAWVTRSGDSDLAEPIAVRPTSETIMYPAFAKWIQSHRDLPLRINQWNNVIRWEFKHPQPFLRTREFLWQEGHTAFAEKADAEAEVLVILDLYAEVYQDLLAVPVIKGRKTDKEKFAGADYTTTVEAYVSGTGRGIQGATSHHLGQNFSRMFEVTYDHPTTGMPAHVYQNSWGFTTRSLGVLFMVHGDNKGLVLPPRVAPVQIIVIPCGITNKSTVEERERLISTAHRVTEMLKQDPASYRVRCDDRTHVSPGWKFNHWEMKGVPIRLEIGPQEVTERSTCLVLRHNGEKVKIPVDELCARLPAVLDSIHADLLQKATEELSSHVVQAYSMRDLSTALDAKSLALAPFCCNSECEESVRDESARNIAVEPGAPSMGAKSLCIPFACGFNPALKCGTPTTGTKCFNHPHCTRPALAYTLFGRSY